jgi:hypothetical protein
MKSLAIIILWCLFYIVYVENAKWWLKYKEDALKGLDFEFDFNDKSLMNRYTNLQISIRVISVFTIISFLIILIYNGTSGLDEYFEYSEWYWDIIFFIGLINMFLEIGTLINQCKEKTEIEDRKRFIMACEIRDLKREPTNLKEDIGSNSFLGKNQEE